MLNQDDLIDHAFDRQDLYRDIEFEDEEIRSCREEMKDLSLRICEAHKKRVELSAQLAALGPAKEES